MDLNTGACIFIRNTVKKPEKPKVEVFEPPRNTVKKPEKPKVEVFESPESQKSRSSSAFGSKTSTFGFPGFLSVFLTIIQAPVI